MKGFRSVSILVAKSKDEIRKNIEIAMDQNKEKVFVGDDKLKIGDEQEQEMGLKTLLDTNRITELQERVMRHETFCSDKQERLATLRKTVEDALNLFKCTRETGKICFSEAVLEQKNELKKLKETLDTLIGAFEECKKEMSDVSKEISQTLAELGIDDESRD